MSNFVYQRDGYDILREMFMDKIVQIYPNDTYWKFGRVKEITPVGVVFLITTVQNSEHVNYKAGDLVFLSHHNLSYKLSK